MFKMSTPSASSLNNWLENLENYANANKNDEPSYYAASPETLVTTSQPSSFSIGTGAQVLSNVFSRCLATNHELIIVTCFWAKSASQESLSHLLLKLSAKALSQSRKIQVRLCFSSRSLAQKLFQTSSLDGKIYPPSSWVNLGLPEPESLRGLELIIKSVFVRPFSVMHPKFLLVDRQHAFMPSCNVSWEDWFEGCVEMRGEICAQLFNFWSSFWARGTAPLPAFPTNSIQQPSTREEDQEHPGIKSITFPSSSSTIPTILLPSPHHVNPRFRPFWLPAPAAPPTPLNTFLLHILAAAKTSIFIQTPNLTSLPLIAALFSALKLGVDVHLVTSSRLMLLEQLLTAGTITEFEVWRLRRRYDSFVSKNAAESDLERLVVQPGYLKIGYFHPRVGGSWGSSGGEPVKSHLKCVVVDGEVTVLGSGNMDRASWFTSQELGVAFYSREMAGEIRRCIDESLEGRVDYVC